MIAETYRIVGGRPLRGTVRPSGSKNGSLPTLAATLLAEGETILENVPRIADVETMVELLRALGLRVEEEGGMVRVVNRGISAEQPPDDLMSRMRASHYVLGPVALRRGRAQAAIPGGCRLGARPVEHFLDVLRTLGMEVSSEKDRISLECAGLRGAVVTLDPRHRNPGATFTALMAASLAEGTTTIENACYEPDVLAFCRFLARCGADIAGIGTCTLTVRGVKELRGTTHRINCDRLEAGTFICAAAATRGEVVVEEITREELGETADKFEEAGVELRATASRPPGRNALLARCRRRPRGVEVVTDPFPAFSTDLQPPFAAVLATAEGRSTIRETVFDDRLQYVSELARMGARVEVLDARCVAIEGVESLRGAEVEGGNIRDAAALVIAALGAEGTSQVSGGRFLARGYEGLDEKLRALGADIIALA